MSEMNNRKSQIDHILINIKWKNCLKNCEAYSSSASVGSEFGRNKEERAKNWYGHFKELLG